ncbi:SOS response-associated peptidase family protein [Microbacterium sp. G2-8]|uniref:SOS response-associated peptidase family protein n=1 Tax=Microbacterium sp. G2-8 TaxID=2842454 RepID=UPI001C8A167F|nr:SOS response-associated peptidase family protein [Microbacterium sp. G2-8]
MCASYGLDPRFTERDYVDAVDADLLQKLRGWAEENADETLRPTGKNKRNLNPLIVSSGGAPTLELAWWGYLVDGEPAKFPSINSRSERLRDRPAALRSRAIVPATRWFEMQKPSRTWHSFAAEDDGLLGMAAVTRPGRTSDGAEFTCYSIIMRPGLERHAGVHERMPLLIPAGFAPEWLSGDAPAQDLIDAALGAASAEDQRIRARPMTGRP